MLIIKNLGSFASAGINVNPNFSLRAFDNFLFLNIGAGGAFFAALFHTFHYSLLSFCWGEQEQEQDTSSENAC